VAENRIHPSDLIPEADLLEQHTPLESSSLNDTLIDTESAISDFSRGPRRRGGPGASSRHPCPLRTTTTRTGRPEPGGRDRGPARRGGGAGACRHR